MFIVFTKSHLYIHIKSNTIFYISFYIKKKSWTWAMPEILVEGKTMPGTVRFPSEPRKASRF